MGQAFVPVLAAQQKKGRAQQPFFRRPDCD
jgi:hypothetical protein